MFRPISTRSLVNSNGWDPRWDPGEAFDPAGDEVGPQKNWVIPGKAR